MQFSVEDRLFSFFPGLKIGVLICRVNNNCYVEDRLSEAVRQLKSSFSFEKPQEHPHIKVWRDAYKKIGISPSKYYSSIESIVRRILKTGDFPKINPVVDLYNSISIKYLVPMGGHALEPIEGNIYLSFAHGSEPFFSMETGEKESVDKGEVVYKDDKEVLTRRWVWRQCNKDKVTADTRTVFIPVDIMEGLSEGLWLDISSDLERCLKEDKIGSILHKDILTKEKTSTEFNPFI
ncbi:MAG: phenylalanine--tRNA ligase beta subunit-related protein [Syntrophorhabdaceae bacterium]|nr:phenylalanine--tRNA ligase beta subunit-related protein [Syntrophorhabdaceae bacterium]